jgi:hypothetical protein
MEVSHRNRRLTRSHLAACYGQVSNLRAITTTHAALESTSLVFAYGLDLFYTRVTPSQTFDLLNEGLFLLCLTHTFCRF